jgi:hypothetical protein
VIKLEEVTPDNRGCFDLEALPDFDISTFPFCLSKARKNISLINVKTREIFPLLDATEM